MRLEKIQFSNTDTVVVPHSGKYSLSESRGAIIGDACALLEESSELLADYGNMMGFGGEHARVAKWHSKCQALADARLKHLSTGNDYTGLL